MKKRTKVMLSVAGTLLLMAGCGHSQTARSPKPNWEIAEKPIAKKTSQKEEMAASEAKDSQSIEEGKAAHPAAPQPAVEEAKEPATPVQPEPAGADGIRPEFKAAIDEYEKFYQDYAAFMNRYKANPSDLGLLMEMTSWLGHLEEFDEKLDEMDETTDDMSPAELQYYMEATGRICRLLAEAAM